MFDRLPPLNALRAFESAARLLSFRKAADELHVTPAAISHQIKGLEEHLGIKLFRRKANGLELTRAAQNSVARLRGGFEMLAGAIELIRTDTRADTGVSTLVVGAPPSFAAKWLVPRIQHFVSAYPNIDLRVTADSGFIDGQLGVMRHEPQHPHIAIRFGAGRHPGQRVEKLFSVEAVPMCSPRLLAGEFPLRTPADLRHHALLHDDTIHAADGGANWQTWLDAAGEKRVDFTRGPHFNHASLGLDAAIDAMGVVLSYPVLAEADLAAGRLVMPFDIRVPLSNAYFVVCPEYSAESFAVAAFRRWIFEKAHVHPAPAGGRPGYHRRDELRADR